MPDWDTLFEEKKNRWENPHEDVVSMFASNLKSSSGFVLDLGCGSGRHLKYLENRQFNTVGMDISRNGLIFSKEKLSNENRPDRLVMADMSLPLPFRKECFDHVICVHVIYHNSRQKIKSTIKEILRVMKPGANALITFITTNSYRYGKGKEIEKDTWIPNMGVDKGIPHHFSTLSDVSDLMREFIVSDVKLSETMDQKRSSSHWVVTAQKPA